MLRIDRFRHRLKPSPVFDLYSFQEATSLSPLWSRCNHHDFRG